MFAYKLKISKSFCWNSIQQINVNSIALGNNNKMCIFDDHTPKCDKNKLKKPFLNNKIYKLIWS